MEAAIAPNKTNIAHAPRPILPAKSSYQAYWPGADARVSALPRNQEQVRRAVAVQAVHKPAKGMCLRQAMANAGCCGGGNGCFGSRPASRFVRKPASGDSGSGSGRKWSLFKFYNRIRLEQPVLDE
ncbi:hypothetical protein SCUCBS95973_004177 [Sporothrix curviconia]|uniref:Uncharacterized protein n=1 Tax=Sporothrix curviconia TaxID=1260050 RepID=A0ABP0BLG6_9PEZI